ncbi:ABC transporter ATP-binding protein [Agrobacterium tumefaciens]|uniref:Spermidine/putrescine import ATP-binding protein PotA n=2 Tax=Rhizobium/Agrobacterium group TaxID=227290 RepID=Q9KWE8_RHIRH|nr:MULTISPECIES: ABC transporter ATP-binding protein [Rhizobium/Agrobacterium group]ASK42916.1 polyamine ABC transporter ATP-binding protein [Rhizobium rhizogenes]MCZ7976426.1 ABC transporter ATP-binding protein [Agrobacterium salinitolerans]MDA5243314.1 ABC transporter ATP-binding protein [Agrobacterium sp. MAFF310724]MDA5247504.1 ABC transporter ATP-binding protein [Agrobacterium sp. MAFF210268]TRB03191.1 ABC transporter ATP-binding protein [Agrobacterium tumefaciens]
MGEISVKNISKSWADFKALNNINLDVREGEFLSILGPSGCGKSTLLRIIAGLESPTDGDIVIAGKQVTNDPVWKRKIGFVFQNFALWPHLTVFKNVAMGLELRKTPKDELQQRVTKALRMVQLEALADRLPSQLSGGQQQRVALARAIVLKPDVLLLDEPLSALDKNLRQDMQVELKALQRTLGLTTVFVTHDQEEALSLSDRVVVMNRGVIEQLDTPDNIYNKPVSEYVARFVGEAFFFKGEVTGSNELVLDGGNAVAVKSDVPAAAGKAVAFVRPEWVSLSKLESQLNPEALRGTVERLMFFGQSSDYIVRVGDEQMRVKRHSGDAALAEGDTVAINCIARLLPNEGRSQ